jgi:predicted dehydrogenase
MLRVGIIGAARIAPEAVIKPVQENADLAAKVVIQAVAARDLAKAQAFADEHGIPMAFGSYEELLASEQVDAVYNPLPNSLHAEWTVKALRAGKHVLCEKPLTNNAAEAIAIQRASEEAGCVAVEAFHVLYHPVAARARELARGEIGQLQHVDMQFMVNFDGYDASIRSKMHAPTPMYEAGSNR